MPYDVGRSDRPEVRNPVLGLEAFQRIQELPAEVRGMNADLWYEIARVSRTSAERSWTANKGPMALYWKWAGAWSRHIARALRRRLTEAFAVKNRDHRQDLVHDWCAAAFGIEHATSIAQRGVRFLEEAVELYQAAAVAGGLDPDAAKTKAHELIDFVFGRPAGEIGQELGGVEVTVLALAHASGHSADDEGEREVERVLAKPLEHFAARNAEKNAAGFDVTGQAYPKEII